ncbi:SpaH/EbpB family LPXTG-anchored major pilin [Microbacterium abyssi]|uniref:SpaH/EbpB family LPXTG-anchored major pilin n=1 Tax=Microbacterium abyssi TaxID=2782166 RepID=UPI001887D5D9|nr:SpaH/EbpB family LPXTG-anchored major pilin [Microbacterium sp. A18JL241]
MSEIQRHRRRLTTVATLIGAVFALGSIAAPAYAAPIDATETGSLTVHKYEKQDTASGLPNNGTEVTVPGYQALEGVEFTIQQVEGIDLATNAGWADANALTAGFADAAPRYTEQAVDAITAQGRTLGAAEADTTDASGEAFFGDLDLGLYLVSETSYPGGVTPSAPFLVTVPVTDPENLDDWLYDVHVYPKNSVTAAQKTVTDADDIALGDEIEFTITSDISNEASIDGYRVVDALNSALDYTGTAVTLSNGTAITAGTHFTVAHDEVTNTVTVDFTAAGRLMLAANHTAQVLVEITTTANAVAEISNSAYIYPNAGSFDVDPGDPNGPQVTPPIITKWGSFEIQKLDETGTQLAGAEFSVFDSEADARAGVKAIELDGQTVHAVDGNGILTLSGLRYSDWADGVQIAEEADYQTYWLVETTAPEGYELLAAPVEFTVTAATTATGVDLEVENVPSNAGFMLPQTGGTGTTLIYAAGALLLAGAILMLVRVRHRKVVG